MLDAIRMLREAGAEADDLRVIVNNREGAPRLSSEGDIRIEELYEIQLTRGDDTDRDTLLTTIAGNAALPVGISTTGGGPLGVVLSSDFNGEFQASADLLQEMGIPGDAAGRCAKAIENGRYVLVTDTEVGINAEALLSRAGAADVIGLGSE
ncbi:hypothetical protein [Cohnella yongneupensis]|uniref:Heat induced stress protein YflT n=1 Tax=Cohnella yongneupensis TaxID=425006 RepID=A0ABW0R1G4_9BACL